MNLGSPPPFPTIATWGNVRPEACLAEDLVFALFVDIFEQRLVLTSSPLRETVKYYFMDFFSGKEGVTDLGGTPLPPFTDFPPKICLQKGLKMVFFAQKTPDFGPKNRLRIWGVPPSPPLRTKSAK